MASNPSQFIKVVNDIINELTAENGPLNRLKRQLSLTCNSDDPILTNDRIQAFRTKINNCMFPIPFIGEGNAGKTTLINALLGGSFLPYGIKKTTLVRTYIRHDTEVHYGPCPNSSLCQTCPQLFNSFDEKKCLAIGQENIINKVEVLSKNAIDNEEEVIFVLRANIPCFSGLAGNSPLIPYLVDCCGIEWIKQDTQGFLSVMSAVVAVFSYRDQDPQKLKTAEVLRTLKSSNLEKFFVVSQFDLFYDPGSSSGKDGNFDENQVKEHLAHVLPTIVSKENVFPVSGKWAVNVRTLRNYPSDKIAQAVTQYAQVGIGITAKLENDKVSMEEVEKRSNIAVLEARIMSLVSTVDHTKWSRQIYEECIDLIRKPIEVGEKILRQISGEQGNIQEEVKRGKDFLTTIDECTKELAKYYNDDSLKEIFVSALKEKFEEWWTSVLPCVVAKIEHSFEGIKTKAISKEKSMWTGFSYTVDEFTSELRELENSKIHEQIEKGFMEDVGNHADAVHHHQIAKINDLNKTRNETIANLIQTGVSQHIARTHNRYHAVKKNEATIPKKIFVGEDDSILRHWQELLRITQENVHPKRRSALSFTGLGLRKEAEFYKAATISGDGIKSVMERMIEEMQTSDNIKKLVSDWFLDMVEETLFPQYKAAMKTYCNVSVSEYENNWAEKVENSRMSLLEKENHLQELTDVKLGIENELQELKKLIIKLESTQDVQL